MKLRLSILLLAAALAAAPAAGQTVKSLGYNTTNGQVVYSGTNDLGFPDTIKFGTNGAKVSSGDQFFFLTDGFGGVSLQLGTNSITLYDKIAFGGTSSNALANAAATRTNLGLGATNNVTFSNITASGTLGVSNAATFSTNVTVNGNLSVGSLTTTTPSTWALDATQTAAATNGILALPSNANVIRLTNNNAISSVTNGVLGAFYYLVNQTTNAVTISNVGGITVQGGTPLTLGAGQAATLVATGATNASVAARGDLNDVALGGTANTAPSQTASSGSSLMTRDLVDTEMGTVRDEINHTYWFGLEGQGGWVGRGSGPLVRSFGGGGSFGFGAGITITSTNRIGASARGGMLVIDNEGNAGAVILATNNSVILQARLKRQAYSGAWPAARGAASFQLAPGQFPYETIGSFWGFTTNTIGLFYVPQPTNAWAASTAFTTNDRIAVSNVVWAVATSGTTDTNEPVWTDLIDSTVTNGTAVFRNVGPHTSNQWVLARGHTNASGIVMTNTGKTNFAVPAYNVLTLRYDGPTATMFASVRDSTGTSAEVSLPYPAGGRMPAFFGRPDLVPAGGDVRDTAPNISYFSIQSQLAP